MIHFASHSTTFGTRKKLSSLMGAFLTTSPAMPPSVTNIGALLHRHGGDRRHRFDPFDVHLAELLDEGEHGIQLTLEVVDLLLGHGDAGEVRDAAYGIGVDSH